MSTFTIDGNHFYEAVIAGANNLMANKNELNNINVFPVADGDTGSNMSATARSIIEYMVKNDNLATVAKSAAEGALMGARGNSGMILAQFFYAFAAENQNCSSIDLERFIQSIKKASTKLYEVILNPVEGTILTIISKWVSSMECRYSVHENLKEYFSLIMIDITDALNKTPSQLPILKEKGVVDSGAKGFYHFLEGINSYIHTGPAQLSSLSSEEISPLDNTLTSKGLHSTVRDTYSLHTQPIERSFQDYRYCCEAMVTRKGIDPLKLKNQMSAWGDSLILAGGGNKLRIHLHTNDPENMFAALTEFGQMNQIKADDMALQSAIVKQPISKIAIVTDSIADLPEDYSLNHQVSVIPLNLEIDGIDYLDRITMSTHRFYEINHGLKSQPKSSLPSIKQVESLLRFLSAHFDGVLVLSVSDKLSGTYQMVSSIAKSLDPSQEQIQVINTLKNSGAQGLLVLLASSLAEKNYSLSEIVAVIQSKIDKTQIYVAVDTTKYLGRSGRVSISTSKIASWIHLKPIMTLDLYGNGKAYGATLSFKSTVNKIKKTVLKTKETEIIECYNIVHAASPERAQRLAFEMTELLGFPPAYIAEISPIVGAVAGEGAVALSYMLK